VAIPVTAAQADDEGKVLIRLEHELIRLNPERAVSGLFRSGVPNIFARRSLSGQE
jgi:hypothetical protein